MFLFQDNMANLSVNMGLPLAFEFLTSLAKTRL
jgi:hypothetical protein